MFFSFCYLRGGDVPRCFEGAPFEIGQSLDTVYVVKQGFVSNGCWLFVLKNRTASSREDAVLN